MSLSSCSKCWDNPCSCGWEYRGWTKPERLHMAANVLGIPLKTLVDALGKEVPIHHPQLNLD